MDDDRFEIHSIQFRLGDSADQGSMDEQLSSMGSEGWQVAAVTALPATSPPVVVVVLQRSLNHPGVRR